MTNFEGWTNLCHENESAIWPVSIAINRPNSGLYVTKRWYWIGHKRFYCDPVYHVWLDDERKFIGMSANKVTKYWLKLVKELGLEVENFEQSDMEV